MITKSGRPRRVRLTNRSDRLRGVPVLVLAAAVCRERNVLALTLGVQFHWRVEEVLAEAVEVVLGDVRRTTSLEPVIGEEDWVQEPGTASAMLGFVGGYGQRGVYVQSDSPLPERLVHIAGIVQDEVTDQLWEAWPRCPLHRSHPLSPKELDGAAWWVCPTAEQPICQVGHLEAS